MEQPTYGSRTDVYETPISDSNERKRTRLTKADMARYIFSILKESCQSNVSEQYVKDSIADNTIIIIMFQTIRERVNVRWVRTTTHATEVIEKVVPLGFILANPDEEGYYIDVICSIRNTKDLLTYFINYCEGSNITLHALPSVLSFYPKFNFKFRESCDKPIVAQLPEKLAKRNTRINPFPKKSVNAYDDEDFSEFMVDLVEKGLAVKKDGDCSKNPITKDEVKRSDCGEDGFIMTRCANNLAGGKRKTRRMKRTRKNRSG